MVLVEVPLFDVKVALTGVTGATLLAGSFLGLDGVILVLASDLVGPLGDKNGIPSRRPLFDVKVALTGVTGATLLTGSFLGLDGVILVLASDLVGPLGDKNGIPGAS